MQVVARACFEPHRDKSPAAGHFVPKPTQWWTGHSRDRPPSPQTLSVWQVLNHQGNMRLQREASECVSAAEERVGVSIRN
jgi:hypothetical protein